MPLGKHLRVVGNDVELQKAINGAWIWIGPKTVHGKRILLLLPVTT